MGDESPKNKLKFLCSHGGKVLPRPSDGLLRYVGGETRVVSVPRDINFSELMKKVKSIVEGEMILKYQLLPEDLDALVSVRTDEDVKHMIEEHDRHQNGLLRSFLFPPSKPSLVSSETYPLEQRYIDAINGIIRTSPKAASASSAKRSSSSSPQSTSPDYSPPRFSNPMQRVRSSPSLTNIDHVTHHHHNQNHNHNHNHNQNQNHQHHHHHHHPFYPWPSSSSTSRPPQDPQFGRLSGKGAAFNNYYHSNTRHRGYQDDSSYALVPISVSRSPRTKSVWE